MLNASNSLSIARILLTVPTVWALLNGHTQLVLILAAIAYISDLLDGYLARKLDQITDVGKILDPLADKIYVAALAIVMLLTGQLPIWLALLILLRDVLILCGGIYARRKTGVVLASNYTGKVAVVSIGLCLLAIVLQAAEPLLQALFALATLMMVASLLVYGKRFVQVIGQAKGGPSKQNES